IGFFERMHEFVRPAETIIAQNDAKFAAVVLKLFQYGGNHISPAAALGYVSAGKENETTAIGEGQVSPVEEFLKVWIFVGSYEKFRSGGHDNTGFIIE